MKKPSKEIEYLDSLPYKYGHYTRYKRPKRDVWFLFYWKSMKGDSNHG